MVGLEQYTPISAPEEEKGKERSGKVKKIIDANNPQKTEARSDENKEDSTNLSEDEAEADANTVLDNPETKDQLDQLNFLLQKYEDGALKNDQRTQFENLISDIKNQLDSTIPRVTPELNNDLSPDFYNQNPKLASEMAESIVSNTENIKNIRIVKGIISNIDNLPKDKQKALKGVLDKVKTEMKDFYLKVYSQEKRAD